MFSLFVVLAAGLLAAQGASEPAAPAPSLPQGRYFAAKAYVPQPLPKFAEVREQLPAPVYDEQPVWVAMYWKAWELAFRNFHEPAPGSGFVSQFIDAAFNQNIFLWDTCFLTMFCNFAHPLVPGIGSLDNFYAKQHDDGEICREIVRATGRDYPEWVNREKAGLLSRWGWEGSRNAPVTYRGRPAPEPPPLLTLDALNHPILAWAEMESFRVTGDRQRLARVYVPLVQYYGALQKYIRQGNGLYLTDWASMDNSPRNPFLQHGGTGIDISAEMVLFARHLAAMAQRLNKPSDARRFGRDAEELSRLINRHMWDPERKFYFDLTLDGKRAPVKTVAAFWTLLADVASGAQARSLVAELRHTNTFARLHRVPTLAADAAGYNPAGGYWCGAVWPPTTTMVIRGLENYGQDALAREIALNHLDLIGQVFQNTGTVWENYAPDAAKPGRPAKRDFVGWTGIGPILFLLEFAIGLKPDADRNELVWHLHSPRRHGCERFRFNGHVVSLLAQPGQNRSGRFTVSVQSSGAFKLRLVRAGRGQTFAVRPGAQTFTF